MTTDITPLLVQPILVPQYVDATHEDTVMAVATAAVGALLDTREDPLWDQWLAKTFTKTVRRGKPGKVAGLQASAVHVSQFGDSQALAFKPTTYMDMPRPMASMQVQGLDFTRTSVWAEMDDWRQASDPLVVVNGRIEMTTGKTAAQVAHGLMGVVLRRDADWVAEWRERGMPWKCTSASTYWGEYVDELPVKINDAGFTEVAPNTLTVVAR